uniref:glycosyltransferase family 39 protein n=1 Tax=Flavobacterium sp. TaxID=239 RepID=UPI00404B7411
MVNKLINWIKSNKYIILILIVGSFLRLFHLDFQSVWLDEVHTLNESNPKLSFQEVHETLLIAEPHPPLYFFIMNVFFNLFGYTTFVARLFSALIGITGIYAIYLLGKELFSKKVGIYAMILLSVNYFHIYYSQDARMYALLFFTTTLSFYFLTKLIKSPTIRNTVLFSLTSTLMIYSHFFALFTLIAQYLILLYFIIFPFNTTRIKFLKYTFLSGILTVLLYIPTYKLILKTTQMQSIWIQMPDKDAYTQFFKDFFGQSEMILFLIIPILLLYFIKLFNVKSSKKFNINPNEEKHVFSFIILFIWIIITLLIPLIRTHTSLPMLVNRYFINVLPAILIVLAIGIYLIKNKIIRNVIISIIFIFSITDIFIVKSYYTNTTKTQFREASSFVLENNKLKEPIFTT